MKILFLDNDGVICLSNNWGSRSKKRSKYRSENPNSSDSKKDAPIDVRLDDFDKKAIKVLNEIIEETGCDIVVSSDWRLHANLEELGYYYMKQGIIKKPIAVTDIFEDIFPKEWNAFRFRADLELERSMEIGHWLENHPEVTHWVAVDDLNMSFEFLSKYFSDDESNKNPGLSNFVLTPRLSEGIKQTGIKEKIIKYLKDE